ncbi:phosphatidylserine decarboxylase, partial [Tremellales sp. Uapishka_1]
MAPSPSLEIDHADTGADGVGGSRSTETAGGGTSDPFITLVLPPSDRHSTIVVKKTLNPSYPPESSTFDFPIYLSLAGIIGGRGLEGVVWDKDLMRKEYMGEFALPVHRWFADGPIRLWSDDLPLVTIPLLSTRTRRQVTGTVSLQIGFVRPPRISSEAEAISKSGLIYNAILQRGSLRDTLGILSVPAHEGIGTVKIRTNPRPKVAPTPAFDPSTVQDKPSLSILQSATSAMLAPMVGNHKMVNVPSSSTNTEAEEDDNDSEDLLADDGLSSSSSDEDDETPPVPAPKKTTLSPPPPPKTAGLLTPLPTNKHKTPARQTSLPGYFDKPVGAGNGETPTHSTPGTPGGSKVKRPIFKRGRGKTNKDFNFDSGQGRDVLGIVIMEVKNATDLPKLKNSLRVSFDMDPFVVISFGKKVFRTRVIRHSLNPTWDEKLLFHVKRHESTFTMQFSVLDWDKVSGNDMVGTCTLPLEELVADAPRPDPATGLYGKEEDGKHEMKEFTLAISTDKDMPWEARHSPQLTIRAKYEPYDALRQRFWRQYITQYDADDTGTMSYTELTTMLDSLGSTLTTRTLEGYFSSSGKDAEKDELTIEEVILCLEKEVTKPRDEKELVKGDDFVGQSSGSRTPSVAPRPANEGLEMTGPQGNLAPQLDADELAEHIRRSRPRDPEPESDSQPGNLHPITVDSLGQGQEQHVPAVKVDDFTSSDGDANGSSSGNGISPGELEESTSPGSGVLSPASGISDSEESTPPDVERVINIKTCPLCHRPRLGKRNEQDIVTHLAICASADWERVDRIVTGNYVTSSQAQRKFFTKIINKVTIGAYSLGANSANILVQDRRTGQLQEEKMSMYVRLGIRVLYKGAKSRMEGTRARKLLKSLSVKQGIKYDLPSSAVDIPPFIAFHQLKVDEILEPISSFKTFNQFFYRKLKPGARPVEDPNDEYRLVSPADCRMMAFETVQEATSIWIKGREFTVGRLLGPEYHDVKDRFEGGALGIFRLAPQDYHRFHSPVKGRVGKMTLIDGEYYTVNPQAIRTTLDVYGENVRKIVPVHSDEFGMVMTVWVGAMMVGSIGTSVVEGQEVERADELGWFAFGGSTIVCLFEKGAVKWDEDLLSNGRSSVETLVRMGMGVGRGVRSKEPQGVEKKGSL